MNGKSLARLAVVVVLIVGLLSLFGCGAAWISYSKESQAKQGRQTIVQLNQQIKSLQEKVDQQKAEIQQKDFDNINLINDKKDLINEKKDLFDQLKKKGYKITITSSGGYEIDEAKTETDDVDTTSNVHADYKAQVQKTIEALKEEGKKARESAEEIRKSTESLKKEFEEDDKPEQKADK